MTNTSQPKDDREFALEIWEELKQDRSPTESELELIGVFDGSLLMLGVNAVMTATTDRLERPCYGYQNPSKHVAFRLIVGALEPNRPEPRLYVQAIYPEFPFSRVRRFVATGDDGSAVAFGPDGKAVESLAGQLKPLLEELAARVLRHKPALSAIRRAKRAEIRRAKRANRRRSKNKKR